MIGLQVVVIKRKIKKARAVEVKKDKKVKKVLAMQRTIKLIKDERKKAMSKKKIKEKEKGKVIRRI